MPEQTPEPIQDDISKPSKIKLKKSLFELNIQDKKELKAAAVRYDLEKDAAPKILVAGHGALAKEIIEIAEENNIPLYEDPILADLLSKLDMQTEIPKELYILVAEVLSFVYQLDKMAKKKERIRKKFIKM